MINNSICKWDVKIFILNTTPKFHSRLHSKFHSKLHSRLHSKLHSRLHSKLHSRLHSMFYNMPLRRHVEGCSNSTFSQFLATGDMRLCPCYLLYFTFTTGELFETILFNRCFFFIVLCRFFCCLVSCSNLYTLCSFVFLVADVLVILLSILSIMLCISATSNLDSRWTIHFEKLHMYF